MCSCGLLMKRSSAVNASPPRPCDVWTSHVTRVAIRVCKKLHLVHYNVDMYSRASEAACSDKGLSVLAVFFKEGKPHEELKKLTDCMSKVIYKGMKCPLEQDIDINSLIPANSSYWTYEGSLTTPPCYESVTWIVFKEPIEVSREQFEAFRQLLSYKEGGGPQVPTDGPILKNFRPPQALNDRVVREPSE